jgi:hypothetical protein
MATIATIAIAFPALVFIWAQRIRSILRDCSNVGGSTGKSDFQYVWVDSFCFGSTLSFGRSIQKNNMYGPLCIGRHLQGDNFSASSNSPLETSTIFPRPPPHQVMWNPGNLQGPPVDAPDFSTRLQPQCPMCRTPCQPMCSAGARTRQDRDGNPINLSQIWSPHIGFSTPKGTLDHSMNNLM